MNNEDIEKALEAAFSITPSTKDFAGILGLSKEESNIVLFKITGHLDEQQEHELYKNTMKKVIEAVKTDPIRCAVPFIKQMEQYDRDIGSRMTRNHRDYSLCTKCILTSLRVYLHNKRAIAFYPRIMFIFVNILNLGTIVRTLKYVLEKSKFVL
jgi:hypothetical protein